MPKKAKGTTARQYGNHPGGAPRKFANAQEMQDAIDAYYASCAAEDQPLTIAGLADALDMGRTTLYDYCLDGEFSNVVKKARLRVEKQVEALLLKNNGAAAAGIIFWLKNNTGERRRDGYQDRQEIEQTGTINLSITPDDAAIL